MFKWFKKFNLSDPSTFWRYVVVAFGVGLVFVFVGQTIFLFVMSEVGLDESLSLSEETSSNDLDPQIVSQLIDELTNRPNRLADVLATTTTFVDPSL